MKTALELLKPFNPCNPEYLEGKDPIELWNTCERGDWMLWAFAKLFPNRIRELTLAKGHIANQVRHLITDERSTIAIDTAIAFGEGIVSEEILNGVALDAGYAAYAAFTAAADSSAAFAAKTAAYAIDSAYDSATAFTHVAAAAAAAKISYAAASACNAAYAAADSAAWTAPDTSAKAAADAIDSAYAAANTKTYNEAQRQASLKRSADICREFLPFEHALRELQNA